MQKFHHIVGLIGVSLIVVLGLVWRLLPDTTPVPPPTVDHATQQRMTQNSGPRSAKVQSPNVVDLVQTADKPETWKRATNIEAVRQVLLGAREVADGPHQVMTLASRNEALRQLRHKHNATATLTEQGDQPGSGEPRVIAAVFSEGGYLQAVHAFMPEGLATVQHDETPDVTVQRFIIENAGLFDLQASDVTLPSDLSWLKDPHVETMPSPDGKTVVRVEFQQEYRGMTIRDAAVSAVFWDGKMASFEGPVVNPAEDLANAIPDGTPWLAPDLAVDKVRNELSRQHGRWRHDVHDRGVSFLLARGRFVREIQAVPDVRISTLDADDAYSQTFLLDAYTGEIVHRFDDRQWQTTFRTPIKGGYKVYKPQPGDATPDSTTQVTVLNDAYVTPATNWGIYQVYPWEDTNSAADRSATPVYNASVAWSDGLGFNYHNCTALDCYSLLNEKTFSEPDTSVHFKQQHTSYWLQKAMQTANINFYWWPPSNSAYRYAKVTAITYPGFGGNVFGSDGCWGIDLWRDSDGTIGASPKVGCIRTYKEYGPGNVTSLRDLWHEYGHAVDWKYLAGHSRKENDAGTCNPGSPTGFTSGAHEGGSLGEAIAALYAATMAAQEFPGALWTDYDVAACNGGPAACLAYVAGVVNMVPVHTNTSDVRCWAKPGVTCVHDDNSANAYYTYTWPLLQAYWESVHGRNCNVAPGQACVMFNDGAGADEARWAFFYAMKNSNLSAGYWTFVANFLTYYYYSVGQTQWNNRWWVFNHHRLVGTQHAGVSCWDYTP